MAERTMAGNDFPFHPCSPAPVPFLSTNRLFSWPFSPAGPTVRKCCKSRLALCFDGKFLFFSTKAFAKHCFELALAVGNVHWSIHSMVPWHRHRNAV